MTDDDGTVGRQSVAVWVLGVPAALLFAVSLAALSSVAVTLVPSAPLRATAVGLAPAPSDGRTAPTPPAFYVELAGVAGSLALSLALAAIYVRQNDVLRRQTEIQRDQTEVLAEQTEIQRDQTTILDDQTEIQRDQTEIQRDQTRIAARRGHPLLTFRRGSLSLVAGDPTLKRGPDGVTEVEVDGGGDAAPRVCAVVENHGEVVARRLQLVCLVDYAGEEPTPPDRVFPGIADVTVDSVSTEPPSGEGGFFPPREEPCLLVATPQFSSASDYGGGFRRFLGGVESHLEDGDEQIRFGFVLVFTNAVGSPFEIVLEPGYAVDPADYDGETDELTVDRLRDLATGYDTADLVDDLDWEIPEARLRER